MENSSLKLMQREGFNKTKKVSQNGISYVCVTYSSKSVPFQKAKKLLTSKCVEYPRTRWFRPICHRQHALPIVTAA